MLREGDKFKQKVVAQIRNKGISPTVFAGNNANGSEEPMYRDREVIVRRNVLSLPQ